MDKSHSIPAERRASPWFDDGNVVIMTQDSNIAFKVHRGVLARHSEVFQTMFEIPPPSDIADIIEGCQVVPTYDHSLEMSHLIKALYDGPTFEDNTPEDFCYLAGVLRLATKYVINHLRTQAIQHLVSTWSITLRGHDDMIQRALQTPERDNMTYPYVHPLHVLNLAREVNVRMIVPSVLYSLSMYPLDDILRGDHVKLKLKHPSRPSSQISATDLKDYTLMFQYRLNVLLDFVRRVCGNRTAEANCLSGESLCNKGFARLAARLGRSWTTKTNVLYFMAQTVQELSESVNICHSCRKAFLHDIGLIREEIWGNLPTVVGLPCWVELVAADMC